MEYNTIKSTTEHNVNVSYFELRVFVNILVLCVRFTCTKTFIRSVPVHYLESRRIIQEQ